MSPFGALALGIFGVLLLLGVTRRNWAVVMIMTFPAFEQLLSAYSPLLATRTWITNVAVGVCALASLAAAFVNNERPIRGYFNPMTVMVFLLYLIAAFGVFYSMMPAAGQYFIKSGLPYYVLMLAVLPMLVKDTGIMNRMAIPLLLIGVTIIGLILISPRTVFYGLRMFVDLSYARGASDERGNPLAMGELGGLMIIIGTLVVTQRAGWFWLLLRVSAVALGMVMCVLASVRGQLIFAAFFALLMFPLSNNLRNVKQFFIRGGIVGVVLVMLYGVFKVFLSGSDSLSRFSVQELGDGVSGRMYFISTIMAEYGQNPANYLQGLGTGSFNAVVPHGGEGFLYPHNLVFEVLSHHGVIGLTVLVIIFLLTARSSLFLYRAAMQGHISRGSVAITLALAGYVTMISMKQGSFLLYPLPFYMFVIIARMHRLAIMEAAEQVVWDDDDAYEPEPELEDGYDEIDAPASGYAY